MLRERQQNQLFIAEQSPALCVLTILKQAKAGSNKNIITNQQHPKKQQKICLNVILTLRSPIKNGVQISQRKRFLDLNKKYFFAQSLTFTIDIHALSNRNDTALVQAALDDAWNKEPNSHAMLHSDRGFQFTRKPFAQELQDHGMTQSMSRVSHCIDNGPMEGWQGLIKEMLDVLYPEVKTYDEMKEAFDKTIDYYINQDPQERFNGKTAGQVRAEAKTDPQHIIAYKIVPNKRYAKWFDKIQAKKNQLE